MDLMYLTIMMDRSVSEIQKRKEKEYKNYVDNHIHNVSIAWKKMKKNDAIMKFIHDEISRDTNFIISLVNDLVASHDLSKYSVFEWEAYRKNFFPIDDEEKEENYSEFRKAWEHHYMNNMHHWNYWKATNQVEYMPYSLVIEMCCDWIAMSMVFTEDQGAYGWYKKQTDIILGDKQRYWVESILKLYYGVED